MADLTVHGIDDEVWDRLRRDAEEHGLTMEGLALHILANWHGLLANRNALVEGMRETSNRMTGIRSEISVGLEQAKRAFEEAKRNRTQQT